MGAFGNITVVHKPGMADDLLREVAPLLAADGIDIDNAETYDLDTLNAALGRAVERRNFELMVATGAALEHALATLSVATDGDGRRWKSGTGTVGLGTSGSGDVLAGIIAGLSARGATPAQAAVWGTHVHGAAGDRLGASVGYLARELTNEISAVMAALN